MDLPPVCCPPYRTHCARSSLLSTTSCLACTDTHSNTQQTQHPSLPLRLSSTFHHQEATSLSRNVYRLLFARVHLSAENYIVQALCHYHVSDPKTRTTSRPRPPLSRTTWPVPYKIIQRTQDRNFRSRSQS